MVASYRTLIGAHTGTSYEIILPDTGSPYSLPLVSSVPDNQPPKTAVMKECQPVSDPAPAAVQGSHSLNGNKPLLCKGRRGLKSLCYTEQSHAGEAREKPSQVLRA